jgi:hypothetical protein
MTTAFEHNSNEQNFIGCVNQHVTLEMSFKSDPVSATKVLPVLLLHVVDISCCKMQRPSHAMRMDLLPAIRRELNMLRNLRNRGFRFLIVVKCQILKVSRKTPNVLTHTIESVCSLATNSPSLITAIS